MTLDRDLSDIKIRDHICTQIGAKLKSTSWGIQLGFHGFTASQEFENVNGFF